MKKILISASLLILLLLIITFVVYINNDMEQPNIEELESNHRIPTFLEDRSLSTEDRMESIKISTSFLDYVVVGTPIEIIADPNRNLPDMEVDYYFVVENWLFGEPRDEIIRVRSQIGHVFKIGESYTFAAPYMPSFNHYNIIGHAWFLNNNRISEDELKNFRNSFDGTRADPLERASILETAEPTKEFMENVDVAIVATVKRVHQRTHDQNLGVSLELRETVYGELNIDLLHDPIIERGSYPRRK